MHFECQYSEVEQKVKHLTRYFQSLAVKSTHKNDEQIQAKKRKSKRKKMKEAKTLYKQKCISYQNNNKKKKIEEKNYV